MKKPLMHGWEVETCTYAPVDDDGLLDMNNAKWLRKECATIGEARLLAKKFLKTDYLGSVSICEFQRELKNDPLAGYSMIFSGKTFEVS